MKHFEVNPEHLDNPPKDCYGCKIAGVSFGSVPGGTRAGSFAKQRERKFDKDMHTYREARRSGERPDATTVEGVRSARQRRERLERGRNKLASMGADTSNIRVE